MEYNLPVIREQLVQCFNLSELRELCFQLDVDHEIINGENKIDKSRELLTYLNRRARVQKLIDYCSQERPHINWNVTKTVRELSDDFAGTIGLTPTISNKYNEAKFELYRSTWNALYVLKEAGEQLWKRASKENIAHFANRLHEAQRLVGANQILFDKNDHSALLTVMDEFNQFRAGKVNLSSLRSTEAERNIYANEIRYQIRRNGDIKERYEALLDKVSDQFRSQLNAWTTH